MVLSDKPQAYLYFIVILSTQYSKTVKVQRYKFGKYISQGGRDFNPRKRPPLCGNMGAGALRESGPTAPTANTITLHKKRRQSPEGS